MAATMNHTAGRSILASRTRAVDNNSHRAPEGPSKAELTAQAIGHGATYLFLGIVIFLQLVPFWLALSVSSKPVTDTSSTLIMRFADFDWENWTSAFHEGGMLRAVFNSVVITLITTILVCLISAFAAYPLARRATRWNAAVLSGFVALMMVPSLSILVPLYTFMVQIGGTNNYWGIILVLTAQNLPMPIFLYAAFIRSIPASIDEAGMIDGANRATVFFRLILPLLKPVTATVVIMTSVGIWNEYAMSNYFLTDTDLQPIAVRVASFFSAQGSNLGPGAAAALMGAVPIVIVYIFLQRYFIAGVAAGSVK